MTGTRFQNGCLMLAKNRRADNTWFFRYYADVDGRRVYKKLRIGTVREFPSRREAEKAALGLRAKINCEVSSPDTVNQLLAHYQHYELITDRKSFATIEGYKSYIRLHLAPRWGEYRISAVRTIEFEQWLTSLPLAPGTRTKIRNIASAVFSHGIRHQWIQHNPISKVRCSAIRQREPDVLTPEEFNALLQQLELRERVMVLLAGTTGLRRSEMFALRWCDMNFPALEIQIRRAVVRNRFGNVKTPASKKPVPLLASVAVELSRWRRLSLHNGIDDFLFPSTRLNGARPLMPHMVLKKILRPALVAAGVKGKVIGWHSFRHSLATNLRSLGVDVKVAQELLRHANSRVTMDIYTQAVSAEKRLASERQFKMLLGGAAIENHPESSLDVDCR